MVRTQRRLSVALIALSLVAGARSFAGESPASPGTTLPDVDVEARRLGEEYVLPDASVGTKTDTPLIETPLTVQVIPQAILREQFSQSLNQTLMTVGVYSAGYEPSSEGMYFRGFFTTITMWNGFRIDEAGTTQAPTVGAVDMDNVERVEVVKGPAAVLYGRLEPGGMVNVVTKQPLDSFRGEVAGSLGSWSDEWLAADLTGPLDAARTLTYRINASEEHSHSWYEWGPDYRSLLFAPVLQWKPSSDTKISLEGYFRKAYGMQTGGAIPIDPSTDQTIAVPPSATLLPGNDGTFDQTRLYANLEHKFNDRWSTSWKVLDSLSVLPDLRYEYQNYAYFPPLAVNDLIVDRFLFAGEYTNRTAATMVDTVGHFGALGAQHTLLLGGDYYDTALDLPIGYSCCYPVDFYNPTAITSASAFYTPIPGYNPSIDPGFGGYNETLQHSLDYGLYVQDQITFQGGWHLMLGERYQHYLQTTAANSGYGTPMVAGLPVVDHVFTPRGGVLWRPRDWLSLYYSYASNFGQNNGFAFPDIPLKPETSRQHELGVKTEFGDGRLTSSLAIFDLTKFDIAAVDPAHPNFSILVGEVKSTGLEYNLQGEVARNWNAIVNFSLARPYVIRGASGAPLYGFNSAENIVTGMMLPGVPERTFSLWTSYRPPASGWKFGGGENWASSETPAFEASLTAPAYWTTALFAAYDARLAGRVATLQLNINNVFNRVYDIYFIESAPANLASVGYGTPRQVKLSVRVEL